jgi:hypothetical protein
MQSESEGLRRRSAAGNHRSGSRLNADQIRAVASYATSR